VPDEPLPPEGTLGFRVNLWGMETWGDLFTPRQALALSTFVRLVREAHQEVLRETGDAGFARAVATCLALAVSNTSPYFLLCQYTFKEMMDLRSVSRAVAFRCGPTSPRPTP
jgi:adenine-specific DNA methylase